MIRIARASTAARKTDTQKTASKSDEWKAAMVSSILSELTNNIIAAFIMDKMNISLSSARHFGLAVLVMLSKPFPKSNAMSPMPVRTVRIFPSISQHGS